MTVNERTAFGHYAKALGLAAGTVATLLMIRELSIGRLGGLKVDPKLRPVENTAGTVTSHRFSKSQKRKFERHVEKVGVPSTSQGLGILCRAELQERWLENALQTDSKRVGV
jgi:hypothetical protein